MRKLFTVILFFASSLYIYAQERVDSLFFHNGEIEGVIITANYDDKIEYCYPGETMTNYLMKNKLVKIVTRTGRTIVCTGGIDDKEGVSDPNLARLVKLKDQRVSGIRADFGKPEKVSMRVVFSDSFKPRLSSSLEELSKVYTEGFIQAAHLAPVYEYSKDRSRHYAELIVVSADADGEMFGIMDFYLPGEKVPCLSIYMNGNGYRTSDTFESKLYGGVIRSAEDKILLIPCILYDKTSENVAVMRANTYLSACMGYLSWGNKKQAKNQLIMAGAVIKAFDLKDPSLLKRYEKCAKKFK